ncbi:hypothetical protein ASD66_04165 [Nocardioides sp. Root151]|nr:DUF6461 domain-containing protein [Nocardioides sp. Root151]KQZ75549.1 hypothetical protein ASD66_04165 [Nocardioides sp. Root151]
MVSACTWLSDSSAASCLSVIVGSDVVASASAYGVDLADSVALDSEQWSSERLAAVVAVQGLNSANGPVSFVLEDNGFEGSRELVLRTASKGGKAASIFWNVDGMVVFSCARRGKLLWSGELGMDDDLDALPRSLMPFAEVVASDEERDPVAVGGAMVAAFTGIQIRSEWVTDVNWCVVSPHVEQPELLTAESSGLRWDHSDVALALVEVSSPNRRLFVHTMVRAAALQASLAEDEVVAATLASVRVDGPGTVSREFESWERQRARENDQLWLLQDQAINAGGVGPLPEEKNRIYRANSLASALRYACHDDDLTALLGVADAAVNIFRLDGHEDQAVRALMSAASAAHVAEVTTIQGLPRPPSAQDRDLALDEQRSARQRARRDAELAEEATFWGGRPPTSRMRTSGGAYSLASRDRDLLDLLEPLPDTVLTAIRDWAAHRVLSDAGLWDLSWVQEATRGQSQLDALFDRLFSDPQVEHTDFLDRDGMRVSRQAMALPAVAAYSSSDPFDAACTALAAGGDGPPGEAAAFYRETRQRLGF